MSDPVPLVEEASKSTDKNEDVKVEEAKVEEPEIETATRIRDRA